jgi:hypothetical protein
MKKIIYIPVLLFMAALTLVSCDGLLNADSEQYTFDEQYRMGSENDSLYAFVGILSKLQLLGDRYVLLGELRGDLMETGDNASKDLKEINEFSMTKENPYAKPSVYYDIINNCNYVIQYVDTAKRANSIKYNVKVMAMAKAVRAWTYLQLVLNYKEVKYFTKPILDEADVTANYTPIGLSELCDTLITDLLPFYQTETIGSYSLGQFADFNTRYAFFPIRFILGDLYLWKGSLLEGQNNITGAKANYKNAATMYYNLMVRSDLAIARTNSTAWTFDLESGQPTTVPSNRENWQNVYTMGLTEGITALASSAEYGKQFTLDSLTFNRMIAPTPVSIAYWDNQIYLESRTLYTEGDLRKRGSISTEYRNSENKTFRFDEPIITKFLRTSSAKQKVILIYRNSLLYLRYAEAVNRLGCSNLAFATLKSGLNGDIDIDQTIQNELTAKMGMIPSYMIFSSSAVFNRTPNQSSEYINVGIHARGCGLFLSNNTYTYPLGGSTTKQTSTPIDTIYYKIPNGVVDAAAVEFVEDKIVEELALETAFEGNRFHDLMRIAIRRNDNAYLADKVSAKYSNKVAMKTKLMDDNNWYIPR